MPPEEIPDEVARGKAIAAHDLGQVRIGIVAASRRGTSVTFRRHTLSRSQHEYILEDKIARVLRLLARLRRPVVERGHGQNAVGCLPMRSVGSGPAART